MDLTLLIVIVVAVIFVAGAFVYSRSKVKQLERSHPKRTTPAPEPPTRPREVPIKPKAEPLAAVNYARFDRGAPPARVHRAHPVEDVDLQADRPRLAQVRKGRWKKLRETFPEVSPEIAEWESHMKAAHGDTVQIHENVTDYVTALYIARYGENEAYWPPSLSEHDVRRARAWARGKLPLGVRHQR